MTEMSWAEKTARIQQSSLDLQLIEMQRQIDELNSKIVVLEEAYDSSTINEEQVES